MDKATYRKIYKEKRLSLSSDQCIKLDSLIFSQLKAVSFVNVQYLHVYLSMSRFNEPDTFAFINYVKEHFPTIQIVISKTDFYTHRMINYVWNDDIVLEESKWGILEPKEGIICSDSCIDMVIVPLLVADLEGNRVGYGKGFYDRFLINCKANVQKIGISYFTPVKKIDDVDEWDVKLDTLITPDHIYKY